MTLQRPFFCFLLLFSTPFALAKTDVVIRVIDGDTVSLQYLGKARLIGVDTPETVHPEKPVEFFGKEATDFTRRHLDAEEVRVEYDWQRTDSYGRVLVYLYLEDGTFFNAELVKLGYAHAYTKYPFKYLEEFREYEQEARENGRGLWGEQVSEAVAEPNADADKQEALVYVTRTGKKYHRDGCRYLSKNKTSISLEAVTDTYGPCSVCRPPAIESKETEPTIAPSYRIWCQAITKKGIQCKRNSQAGSTYCWPHQ